MASIVLAGVGYWAGSAIGTTILGISTAQIGAAIGGMIGSALDARIFAPDQTIEGQRLEDLRVTSSTEGAVIPASAGRMRLGGNIIWATDFVEERRDNGSYIEYRYYASFAVAICEGPITGIGRIWADGDLLDTTGLTMRIYPGDEAQQPDAFIEAQMGVGEVPAYRGTAYVVFEYLNCSPFGNRIPQLSFEVFRPVTDGSTLEGLARAVEIGPGTGEFALATDEIRYGTGGSLDGDTETENRHADPAATDMVVALDRLAAALPNVGQVNMVASWFGDDLRAGFCTIRPRVESTTKETSPANAWALASEPRALFPQVSAAPSGGLAYGGTPADFAVLQAILEARARGLKVGFEPRVLMDIATGNTLPDPYSDNAAGAGQPAYPWRGRITCSPAAGFAGSADKTAAVDAQVAAFFGAAQPGDFTNAGSGLASPEELLAALATPGAWGIYYTGPAQDWGYRRFVLFYAYLCALAGGVDSFVIGSELPGLTALRDDTGSYPAVDALRQLAADVKTLLPDARISYGAHWTEYSGHRPDDGSGDVHFHLDPLWADPAVDFIGISGLPPLTDWRSGEDHLDAIAGWSSIYDAGYLQAGIAGGEGYDWSYASDADRAAQLRTAIADPAYGEAWVFRPKDIRAWWSNAHFDRPGGIRSAAATAWVPQSKPIQFTALGISAVDRAANRPDARIDAKSTESALPAFSRGWRDDAIQRRVLEVVLSYWSDPANNPVSAIYAAPMVDVSGSSLAIWDARPFPDFPGRADIWGDAENWQVGHWLSGRAGSVSLAALTAQICARAELDPSLIDTSELWQVVTGQAITQIESPRSSLSRLARFFGFDAVESGGVIRFRPRDRLPQAVFAPEDLVAGDTEGAEAFELLRGQATELPATLKWNVIRPDDGAYDPAPVEARRVTVPARGVTAETFAFAVPLEEADRRARAALMEHWVGIETLSASLPPSRLALEPGDVVSLRHDGRDISYRLTGVDDADRRVVSATRHDRTIYDLPPGAARSARLTGAAAFGTPVVAFIDLPQLAEDTPPHQPYVAIYSRPWPGQQAIWRSESTSGFALFDTVTALGEIGALAADLPAGPVWRWDHANEVLVDLKAGTPVSVTDDQLFNGANMLAVESAPGAWEVLQFAVAALESPGRYRLSRLLRGQRGTEAEIGAPTPAGARAVLLGSSPRALPVAAADVAREWQWRVGPATGAPADTVNAALAYTPAGRGLQPLSPVHLRAQRDTATLDMTLTWIRRDRALAADSWDLIQTPRSESATEFELEILDLTGTTVLRTISGLSLQTYVYTAAAQTIDFGAPVLALRVRLAQIGALGRGAPLEQFINNVERI